LIKGGQKRNRSMDDLDMRLLWHYVDRWAKQKPDDEAIVFGDERISWREFNIKVDRLAKGLLEIGIEKGDRIAFLGMARPEFFISYMAASKVGAVWLGLSPKFSVDELDYMLRDCRPKLLISLREYMGRDLVPVGAEMVANIPSLKAVLMMGEPVPRTDNFNAFINRPRPELDLPLAARADEVMPDDEALLMYTSGSTGRPKGVLHTHKSIIASAAVEIERFKVDPSSRLLLHFPVNHVAADVEIGFAAVYGGCAVVCLERFDPAESLAVIQRERITLLGQIPAMYLLQMNTPAWPDTDFSAVQRFVWSGAVAPNILVETLAALAKKNGGVIMNAFGMTETAGLFTYTNDDDSLDTLRTTAGKVVEPFELRVVDEQRRDLPPGQVGEMAVRGDLLMKEYFNNPAATHAALDGNGWFYTSDLASMDERGYIHIAGRRSEMFKTGGENVFPREIESVLEAHPSVLQVAVVAVPDEIYAEVGWAYLVLKPGAGHDEKAFREYCKKHMANFKVPKSFKTCPALPMLANGKVDKQALLRQATK